MGVNVGVASEVIVTVIVWGFAQGNNTELGVNVYDPEVFGLMVAGLHVPLIPLGEVVANVGTALP